MTTEIKVLTESEIQSRLYGSYHGGPRSLKSVRPPPQRPAPAAVRPVASQGFDPAWTGSEILSGELKQLRSELISLRKEKEELHRRLHPLAQTQPMGRPDSAGTGGGWLGRISALLLVLLAAAFPLGAQMLQASPAPIEPTPYTVQVAVYDVRSIADRALEHLCGLGYPAFLAEMRRADGRPRYRIYVGSFVTKEEARREHGKLAADPRFLEFKDAFIRIY